MRYVSISAVLLVFLTGIIARPARGQQTQTQSIDALIQLLGDSDSQKRESAQAELTQRGAAARPALLAATRSNDPAISVEAFRVLQTLPWAQPDDSDEVKLILTDYGLRGQSARMQAIEALNGLPEGRGQSALLRLLMEEPNADLCWQIIATLRNNQDSKFMKLVRGLNPPPDDRAPANMLVGLAWEGEDHAKAMEFFNRAIEIEAKNPSVDDGLLSYAINILTDNAIGRHDYDRAVYVMRIEAARASVTKDESPDAVYQLFLLHARYGPLNGFAQDVQTFRPYLGHAEVLYCLSRIYAQSGRTIEAMACETAARSANLSTASHVRAALSFSRSGWTDPMRKELYASLDAAFAPARDEIAPIDGLLQKISARRLLANIATQEANDTAAIEHLTETVTLLNQIGMPLTMGRGGDSLTVEKVQAEIAWRRARLAKARSDQAAVTKHLDAVMNAVPLDSDVVQNVYPLLKAAGRDADAKTIFDMAFEEGLKRIAVSNNDATELNDLAWLCARCDQKLTEALEWSTKAVSMEPDNSAFIDTLAEVNFRLGRAEEAVKLETRALDYRPEDFFMLEQREKFGASIKKSQ